MMKTTLPYRLLFVLFWLPMATFAQNGPLRLWYDKPAQQWEETLPLGNGRLGMMPDGGIEKETIVLNEITLWSGGPQDANNYQAAAHLPQIRSLLLEGKNDEAEALVNKSFVCTGEGSGHGNGANVPFGCYQMLGDLQLHFKYEKEPVTSGAYHRELLLSDAVASCHYTVNGVTYSRTYFTSFDDDVSIVKITADKPGKLNFRISLNRPERFTTRVSNGELIMAGQLNNGTDGNGMKYVTRIKPLLRGGNLLEEGNELVVDKATEVTIYISAGTNFKDASYDEKTIAILKSATQKSFDHQLKNHLANYRKLFDRVSLTLGKTVQEKLTTDQRLKNFYLSPDADKGLPVLYFQFGRYLAISSTRVGLLPPNLQGLWANQVQTPWNGDYHLDVNVQMNHWILGSANLSELSLPLADLVRGLMKQGEKTAKAYYNAEGWVAHVITNVWGYTEPGEDASWGVTNSGSGWLCNNLWDHYAFTRDEKYLESIYPILKGSALFYNSVLMEDPKTGWYVTAPSESPENAFYLPNGKHASICMGPTIDHQITRELFSNVILASEILHTDEPFREVLKLKLKRLPPPGRIASDGRLMEWLEEYKETDLKHRHVSHLYGLYPASLITPDATPDLAEACRKTLEVRGDDSPGWSKAYKLLFWARLHNGNRAYKLLTELLKATSETNMNYGAGGGTYNNLLSAGSPFQIDGNFGGAAGIAEMLLQSHEGYIYLLPALPDAWKDSGEARGLGARGNFTVDMKWKDGKITEYHIYSSTAAKVKVKVNGELKEITATRILNSSVPTN